MKTRVRLHKYSQFRFRLVLAVGALIALVLCVQCVRTYLYTGAVLVPQQAEREAERESGALTTAARTSGINDVHALGPVLQHAIESSSSRILWMRVLDLDSKVQAQAGTPEAKAKIPPRWWERIEKHESLAERVKTSQGEAFVLLLPYRLPRPPHMFEAGHPHAQSGRRDGAQGRPPAAPPGAYVLELAIPVDVVASVFEGLRQNLIVGVIASIALLAAVIVIGLRAPHYFRGKYLENEMELARRVQRDLQPKQQAISPSCEFAALAVAADHVGGDFYDIFDAGSGKIALVLGDVSGKGIPAALLVSVLQGAIRSSNAGEHEFACERINRMLCERTACERFATLFWGVFDPRTGILRYVNAGHVPPILLRAKEEVAEIGLVRLDDGGPVLGLLPNAHYAAGVLAMSPGDTLALYSDGISESANRTEEEFGEARIREIVSSAAAQSPAKVCERLMNEVTRFATSSEPPDDRTVMVVKFAGERCGVEHWKQPRAESATVA